MPPRLTPARTGCAGTALFAALLLAAAALAVWLFLRAWTAPGPAPSAGYDPEAGKQQRFAVEWSKFPVAAEKTEAVPREAGGKVELDDGTRVEIPAGALSADSRVTLRRLTSPEPGDVTITDVDLGGATLAADATVTLPCPSPGKPPGELTWQYEVYQAHEDLLTKIPGRYDPESRTVTARARHFSPILVYVALGVGLGLLNGAAALYVKTTANLSWPEDLGVRPGEQVLLPVPYYSQYHAWWCWAGSTEMMLAAYGERDPGRPNFRIWSLARLFEKRYTEGEGNAGGKLTHLFEERGLPVDYSLRLPYKNHYHLCQKLVEALRGRRPVWLDVDSVNHAVVAVGFDADGIYLHDPSGYLVEKVKEKDKNLLTPAGQYRAAHVRWGAFIELLNRVSFFSQRTNLVWHYLVDQPMPATSPVSINLLPDRLTFVHPTPKPWDPELKTPPDYWNLKTAWTACFAWDGQVGEGYRFCVPCSDEPDPGAHLDPDRVYSPVFPLYATHSDRCALTIDLANGGADAREATLSATLNGLPLGEPRTKETVGPFQEKLVRLTGYSVLLSDLPLTPGRYPLRIQAAVDGATVDSISLDVDVGPSRVEWAEPRPQRRGEETYLVWKKVGEEGVSYHVYSSWPDMVPGREVGITDGTEWRIPQVLLDDREGARWFYIVAVHNASGLRGPPSDFLPLPAAEPSHGTPPDFGVDLSTSPAHGRGLDLSHTRWRFETLEPSNDPTKDSIVVAVLDILEGKPGGQVRTYPLTNRGKKLADWEGTYDGKHLELKRTALPDFPTQGFLPFDPDDEERLSGEVDENAYLMTGTMTSRPNSGPVRTERFKGSGEPLGD